VRWENKVCFDCLLSRQHFCQKLFQSNVVRKDYNKSKVGRFLRHSVVAKYESHLRSDYSRVCFVCELPLTTLVRIACDWLMSFNWPEVTVLLHTCTQCSWPRSLRDAQRRRCRLVSPGAVLMVSPTS